MTQHPTRSRHTLALGAIAVLALSWAVPSAAAEDSAPPSATVSAVTCVEDDGSVTFTLAAGDFDAVFYVSADTEPVGEEDGIAVVAGASTEVTASGLPDGEIPVAVYAEYGPAEEPTFNEILTDVVTVACDQAPGEPYTNPDGYIEPVCSVYGEDDSPENAGGYEVNASNRPIGGDVEHLLPVTFEVWLDPFSDEELAEPDDGVGGEEPPDGGSGEDPSGERSTEDPPPVLLDSFTLDATEPTAFRAFPYPTDRPGLVTLRVGEVVFDSHDTREFCAIVADSAGGEENGGGPAVPNTGA